MTHTKKIIDDIDEDESDYEESDSSSMSDESESEEEITLDDEDAEDDVDEEIEEDVIEEIEEEIDDVEDEAEANEIEDAIDLTEESDLKGIKKRTLDIQFYKVGSTYNGYKYNNMEEQSCREKMKQLFMEILESVKNAETFEKYARLNSFDRKPALKYYVEHCRLLFDYLYEFKREGSIQPFSNKKKLRLSDILDLVKKNQINYQSPFYDAYRDEVKKEIKKIQMPIEVLEGLFTCPKCQGKQTHHYAVQLRSADEPMTVFIHCLNKFCKYKWRKG